MAKVIAWIRGRSGDPGKSLSASLSEMTEAFDARTAALDAVTARLKDISWSLS